MDQDLFRKTYNDINTRPCIYEKALLSGQADCPQAKRFNLAEREGIHCASDNAQQKCDQFLSLVRHHSRFTLKLSRESEVLPHAKAIRIEVGGLRGLSTVLFPEDPPPQVVSGIFELIDLALSRFESAEQFPYQEIIKQVAAYQGRRT
ncbi:MAG: hypothetical protein GY696_37905 [Gammaproteobacteria bacterium]|nr:hypothetical protein [Gammaproteobacteria bacterium]